jgi:uncharacterized membrane protein YGL010W
LKILPGREPQKADAAEGRHLSSIIYHPLWMFAAGLFAFGWLQQFIGHAFAHKEPEFFHDWRFLLVGVRWWWAKMRGRA